MVIDPSFLHWNDEHPLTRPWALGDFVEIRDEKTNAVMRVGVIVAPDVPHENGDQFIDWGEGNKSWMPSLVINLRY